LIIKVEFMKVFCINWAVIHINEDLFKSLTNNKSIICWSSLLQLDHYNDNSLMRQILINSNFIKYFHKSLFHKNFCHDLHINNVTSALKIYSYKSSFAKIKAPQTELNCAQNVLMNKYYFVIWCVSYWKISRKSNI